MTQNNEDDIYTASIKEIDEWFKSSRFDGIQRPYDSEKVAKLRGKIEDRHLYLSYIHHCIPI